MLRGAKLVANPTSVASYVVEFQKLFFSAELILVGRVLKV